MDMDWARPIRCDVVVAYVHVKLLTEQGQPTKLNWWKSRARHSTHYVLAHVVKH